MGEYYPKGQSGRTYGFSIQGDQPTEYEKQYAAQYISGQGDIFVGDESPLIGTDADEERGFFGAVGTGIDTLQMMYGSALEGVGETTGIAALKDIGSGIIETNKQQLQESGAKATRLDDVKDIGTGFQFFKETLGEQVPQFGSTILGGAAGGKAGAVVGSVVPGVGTVLGTAVGTVVGGLAANIPFFYGGNREAQKEADLEAGRPIQVDEGVAALTAIPQATLDFIADRFLIGRIVNPRALKMGGIFSRAAKGIGAGSLAEVPTEVGQQLLERLQAGKSITSQDAIDEYVEVAVAAGIVGGTVRGGTGVLGGDVRKKEAAEAQRQLDEDSIEEGQRAGERIVAGKVGFDIRMPPEPEEAQATPEETQPTAEVTDTNLTKEQKTLALAEAAKEAKRPFSPIPILSLEETQRNAVLASREGTSIKPDADVSREEIVKVFGEDAAAQFDRIQRPSIAPKPKSPIFTVKQKDLVKAELDKRGKVNKGQLKRAAKTDSTEIIDEILRDLENDGVVKHTGRGRYKLSTDPTLDPLYRQKQQRDKARSSIEQIEAPKKAAIEARDKALEQGNVVAAKNLNSQIDEIEANAAEPKRLLAEAEAEIDAADARLKEQEAVEKAKTEREEAETASKAAREAEAAQYRDEYNRKRKAIAAKLRRYLKSLGLSDVSLDIADYIERDAGLKDPNTEGVYDPTKKSISLAMSIYDPTMTDAEFFNSLRSVLDHEIIHALRDLGLFTDAEYKTLVKAAQNTKYVAIKGGETVKRAYTYHDRAIKLNPKDPNMSEKEYQDLVDEEAISEMFRSYADGRLKVVGKPKTLFDRIMRFFKAIGQAHDEEGFNSAASIFDNIKSDDKSKQVGGRQRRPFTAPSSNAKYSTAGIVAGYIAPDLGNIERINQDFRSVTKRIPKLTDAAKKLLEGEITYDQYDDLVNEFKPIIPYETVPAPENMEDMRNALEASDKRKLEKLGKGNLIENGRRVKLRLDIPAYTRQGVWIPTIHGQDNRTIAHESTAIITDAQFSANERVAARIAAGAQKGPFATIDGSFVQATPDEAFAIAQEMMNDPNAVQVGFDPERHSYFYDRTTTQPVIAAEQVVQVGPLVMARNPVFSPKSQFKYSTTKSSIEPFVSTPERVKSNVGRSQVGIDEKLAQASVLHRIDENNEFIDTRIFNNKAKAVLIDVPVALKILQEESGNVVLDPNKEEDFRKIVLIMAAEAEASLRGDKSAIGWYADKIVTMFDLISTIKSGNRMMFPDIGIDPDHRAAFTFAMAVTSNGVAVTDNFQYAAEQYKAWVETGRFPVKGFGAQGQDAMRKAFEFYNALKDSGKTDAEIQNYLSQKTTVGELKKDPVFKEFGLTVPSQDSVSTEVSVAYILGPKIGDGFYMNLTGNFNPLTMDLWWMRMWNRIIGKPFKEPTNATNDKNRKRILKALEGDLNEYEQRTIEETMLDEGLDSIEGQNVDQFAVALNAKFQREFNRYGADEKDLRPIKTKLFKAAHTHSKNLSGKFEQATPRNGTERAIMRRAAESARELLKERTGTDINNADFQALMWYHEKRLLASMGARPGRGSDNDYVDGAVEYARKEGFTNDEIAEALPSADRNRVYPDSGAGRADEQISRQSAKNDTSANLKYSVSPAKAATIAVRIGAGDNGRVWGRQRSSRRVGEYDVAVEYKAFPFANRLFNEQGIKVPVIYELAQTVKSAQQFAEAIDAAKRLQGPLGASVYVYPTETTSDETGYADMRLFLTEDGGAGFALKDGGVEGVTDIVSVFNTPRTPYVEGQERGKGTVVSDVLRKPVYAGFNYSAMRLAIEEGGNKLDAFDTFLPGAYSANGFTIRARVPWNDEYSPVGWDKDSYKFFNNGEPDLVLMYYNPKRRFTYKNGDNEGERFSDIDEAITAQNGAALNPNSANRFLDTERAETVQLVENDDATIGELDGDQLAELNKAQEMLESLPRSTKKFSTAPSNPFATIAAPKKFPGFEKYNSLFGVIKDNNRPVPVLLFAGKHGEGSDGQGGFGKYHITERGHEKSLVDNSKFPDIETAIQQLFFAWHRQGHKDGESVVSSPDGGRSNKDLRLEWANPSHSSPPIIISLQYGLVSDQTVLSEFGYSRPVPVYSVRTAFPDSKAIKERQRKRSVSFSPVAADSTPMRVADQNNFITYSASYNTIAKILSLGGFNPLLSRDKANKVSEDFLIKFQDAFLPVAKMIDDLKSKGLSIADGMDTYLQETLFHGRIGDQLNTRQKEVYEPLVNTVKALNITDDSLESLKSQSDYVRKAIEDTDSTKMAVIDAYLYALHAKERNAYIASINNDLEFGSGMDNAEADRIIAWVENLDVQNRSIVKNAQEKVSAIIADTNRVRVSSGLTPDFDSPEPLLLENGENTPPPRYKNYVPLRGIFDADGEAQEDGYYTGGAGTKGYSVRGREDQRHLGRYDYATNILAAVFLQNQNAVIRSERNKVGISFLELLESDPQLTSQYATIERKAPLTRGLVNGSVRTIVDRNAVNDPHILTVKRGGEHVYVRFRDRRLAEALKGSVGGSIQNAGGLTKAMGTLNRYLSNINTSYNPEFLITNLVRDLQTVGVNISQFDEKGIVREVMGGLVEAAKSIKHVVIDEKNVTDDPNISAADLTGAALFRRFQKAGGQNATNQISDLNDQVANIKRLADGISDQGFKGKWNNVKNSFVGEKIGSLFSLLENSNTVVENAVRVSTFKALVRRGMSEERAAFAARNVSVDFAKGGQYKPLMNGWYLFYNASLQGTFALLNAATRSPTVRKLWVGLMVSGLLQDQIMAAMSDEDEDGQLVYDKIPDHVLEHNWIIPDFFGVTGRSYMTIPLPYGLNMATNIGRSLSRAARGGYTPTEAGESMLGTLHEVLNPLGATEKFSTSALPTILDPFIDIFTNENFAGKPIYKETSPFDPTPPPDSQLYWSTTSPSAKWIAQNINTLTGGSSVEKGFVDLSPDVIEFWTNFVTGGAGNFVKLSTDLGTVTLPKALEDGFDEKMVRQIPFFRKVFYSASEREDLALFINNRNRVLQAREVLQDAFERGDTQLIDRTRLKYADELRIAGIIKSINNGRNRLLRKMAQIKDNPRIPDEQKEKIIERLSEQVEALVKRANIAAKDL